MAHFRRVVCGISGGVDSAVSALLLKRKGFNVQGAFMKNWDVRDEFGRCTSDQDLADAQYVCDHLNIPLHQVNFVKEYWNNVFTHTVSAYENGTTPNPDVLCNKHVKFGAFFNYATSVLGADAVATGHYARHNFGQFLENYDLEKGARMYSGIDPVKDQTLFLCQINQKALQRTMFPVGNLMKRDVKQIAAESGLDKIAKKKESMGICFIGLRNFHDFIEEYIEPKPGVFRDIETGRVMGTHKGTHYWTVGQRSQIGGLGKAMFIVSVDPTTQEILVAPGSTHPALFTDSLYTEDLHWIHSRPSTWQPDNTSYVCQFRFQHIHPLVDCAISQSSEGELCVRLSQPMRAITPGQYAVFYSGEECIASARITKSGPSLYEQNVTEPVEFEKAFR